MPVIRHTLLTAKPRQVRSAADTPSVKYPHSCAVAGYPRDGDILLGVLGAAIVAIASNNRLAMWLSSTGTESRTIPLWFGSPGFNHGTCCVSQRGRLANSDLVLAASYDKMLLQTMWHGALESDALALQENVLPEG
jgi:hypothetical protein